MVVGGEARLAQLRSLHRWEAGRSSGFKWKARSSSGKGHAGTSLQLARTSREIPHNAHKLATTAHTCSGVSMPSVVHTSMPSPRMRLQAETDRQQRGGGSIEQTGIHAPIQQRQGPKSAAASATGLLHSGHHATVHQAVGSQKPRAHVAHPTISSTRSHWPLPTWQGQRQTEGQVSHDKGRVMRTCCAAACRTSRAELPTCQPQRASTAGCRLTWEGPRQAAPMQKRVLPAALARSAACRRPSNVGGRGQARQGARGALRNVQAAARPAVSRQLYSLIFHSSLWPTQACRPGQVH